MNIRHEEYTETRTYKKPIYVAFDGEEFDDVEACIQYEKEIKFDEINDKFHDMVVYHSTGEEMFIPLAIEDECADIIIPQSVSDIHFLNEILLHHHKEGCKQAKHILTVDNINEPIVIEYQDFGDDGIMYADWFDMYPLETHINKFAKAMAYAKELALKKQIFKNDEKLAKK